MKRDTKFVCKARPPVKFLSGAATIAVLTTGLAAETAGASSATVALATPFNSRIRTVKTVEAEAFLSRFRSAVDSDRLPFFRSDIARRTLILIK